MPEFRPSKLGTRQHWDEVYDEEIQNFDELQEEGEIWFGEDSMEKMVKWTLQHAPPPRKILEVGTGNGILLCELVKQGYDPTHLLGIDYSPGSITLSRKVAHNRGIENLTFRIIDFLSEDLQDSVGSWDVLLDKGTFDAIGLAKGDSLGYAPVDLYPGRVVRLLRPGGLFLITSCNFTEDELKQKFITPETGLQYHSHIQHKTFTFGGRSGSVCSSIAFQKPVTI